jgi:hypothetical protein
MIKNISIDNSSIALVVLIIFCVGKPDLLDACICLLSELAHYIATLSPVK